MGQIFSVCNTETFDSVDRQRLPASRYTIDIRYNILSTRIEIQFLRWSGMEYLLKMNRQKFKHLKIKQL